MTMGTEVWTLSFRLSPNENACGKNRDVVRGGVRLRLAVVIQADLYTG